MLRSPFFDACGASAAHVYFHALCPLFFVQRKRRADALFEARYALTFVYLLMLASCS